MALSLRCCLDSQRQPHARSARFIPAVLSRFTAPPSCATKLCPCGAVPMAKEDEGRRQKGGRKG
ncbi:adenosylcobinamide kinase [Sesbania bispinosa]|nr:adenosylcobinamide kinase [Sesbania bispinosa]